MYVCIFCILDADESVKDSKKVDSTVPRYDADKAIENNKDFKTNGFPGLASAQLFNFGFDNAMNREVNFTYVHTYILNTYIHTYIHTYIQKCTHTYTHAYIQ